MELKCFMNTFIINVTLLPTVCWAYSFIPAKSTHSFCKVENVLLTFNCQRSLNSLQMNDFN